MGEDQERADVLLTVCTTCRPAGADPEAPRPGAQLLNALQDAALPDHVTVRGVECLSACSRSCAVVLSGGPDRWTYVYGDMQPAQHLEDILEGVSAYAQTTDGLVPWRQRPQSFRKQTVARIPPLTLPEA